MARDEECQTIGSNGLSNGLGTSLSAETGGKFAVV